MPAARGSGEQVPLAGRRGGGDSVVEQLPNLVQLLADPYQLQSQLAYLGRVRSGVQLAAGGHHQQRAA
jgi:hypothetical protein